MKNGLVISDAGPIFSLAIVNKLEILENLFDEIYIPKAVWEEVTKDQTAEHFQRIATYFQGKIKKITEANYKIEIQKYNGASPIGLL